MEKKSKNMAKIVVFFCITALTAFAGIAQAHEHEHDSDCACEHGGENYHHDSKKMHHHGFMKMEKKLGLTDAQKAQAKAIFQKNRDVVKPIITNLRAEQKNLQALMFADTVNEAAIRAETLKIAGIRADLNVNRAKVGTQFRAILTPAQRETLKSLHNKKCPVKDSTTAAPAK
jgi:periplasmic protein CpxP/Spy